MFLKKKNTFYSSILRYIQRLHCSGVFIVNIKQISHVHSVKSVRIRSYSGLYFPAFGLNMKRYGVFLRIQYECGKIRTRITLNMDTFHAVNVFLVTLLTLSKCWLGN